MNWQQAIPLGMVALAAGLLLWGGLRRRRFHFGRDTHCGCSAGGVSREKGSIVFRARKGGRRAVVVNMK